MAKTIKNTTSSQKKASKNISYNYVALSGKNEPVKGTISAVNQAAAERMLTQRGLKPISLEARSSKLNLEKILPSLFGIKPQEVINFSRQLATLLESGITLLAALDIMRQQSHNRAFKNVLTTLANDLRTGINFSEALAKHPEIFNDIYVRTVAAGEGSGRLDTILRQMAEYQEKQIAAKKKVTGALRYPIIVMTIAILVIAVLMFTALPKLMELFKDMKLELPWPTRLLIAVSDFAEAYMLYMLIGLIAIIGIIVWFVKQPKTRLWLDRRLLTAPLIGPPLHSSEIGRFNRTGSVLLNAGLSLQEVMAVIPSTTGNRAIRNSLVSVNQELIRGGGLHGPLSADNLFPPLMVQMVLVGEQSNTLDTTMGVVADFYENDTDEKITSMVGIIQPMSTIFLASIVAFLAVAIMLPMYSMTQSLD